MLKWLLLLLLVAAVLGLLIPWRRRRRLHVPTRSSASQARTQAGRRFYFPYVLVIMLSLTLGLIVYLLSA